MCIVLFCEQGIAIVSYQCDDRVNGRTYMAYLQNKMKKLSCPFEITPFGPEGQPAN